MQNSESLRLRVTISCTVYSSLSMLKLVPARKLRYLSNVEAGCFTASVYRHSVQNEFLLAIFGKTKQLCIRKC